MQGDTGEQHERQVTVVAVGEQQVAQSPRQHPHQQRKLDPEALDEQRQKQHEQYFGDLPDGHFCRGVGHADFRQERVGVLVVERQRNADQDGGDKKHQITAILEQTQGIQPEHLLEAAVRFAFERCGARQGEAVEAQQQ
ncbi:hypothetical protein D3C75_693410 [compost metagenome]